jgi:hypothetical protein
LCVQIAVTAIIGYGCVQSIELWSRYPTIGEQVVARSVISAALFVVSVFGLWKSQSWGWILALTTDGILCGQALLVALNHPAIVARNARFLAFNFWEFAAVALLLYPPVRQHFFKSRLHGTKDSVIAAQTRVQGPRKWIPILGYFVVTVVGTCAATAFSLALYMGQKGGGGGGFLFLLYLGVTTGGLASFLFVSILTAASRLFGSTLLWVWLSVGGILAPCLIGLLGVAGRLIGTAAPAAMFWGPMTLMQVWWLPPFVGVVAGWLCFTIYPWAFAPSANSR